MNRTRKHYMHPVAGLCVLIHPDPEDGALLVMERIGDDAVMGQYFACEASDLFHVGERVVGAVAKWEDSAPDEDREIDPESVIVAAVPADDSLAVAAMGNAVAMEDRRYRWEPNDSRYPQRVYALAEIEKNVAKLLDGLVLGGVKLVIFGQWRRVV